MNQPTTKQPMATNQAAKSPTVFDLLAKSKDQIALALPKHITPDRMVRIAMTELRKTPMLQQCDPMSFLGAIVQAAQLGLEPGNSLGHCYLIPYKNECTLQIGYRGMVDLARRSGNIKSISARCVYEGDDWKIIYGTAEEIHHVPKFQSKKMTHVYAAAQLSDGGVQFEVMSVADVEQIRDRHSMGYKRNPNTSPWKDHFDEMAKKTVVRRLFKMLPTSIEMRQAAEIDDTEGDQQLHRVIDANYELPPYKPDPEKFAEVSAGKDQPTAADASADRQNAGTEFDKAFAGVKKVGGDPLKILGLTEAEFNKALTAWTPEQIMNAADRLSAWEPPT